MVDEQTDVESDTMRGSDFLRDLAERLMHVPVMYGTDQGDVSRLMELAVKVGDVEAAGDFFEKVRASKDETAAQGDHFEWLRTSALNLAKEEF